MAMQDSYCKAMRYSGPESLQLRDQTKFDVLIQVETLAGCRHSCTGCFVDKHGDPAAEKELLQVARQLADGVKASGLNLREFVVGPTDFFSASNTVSVLNNPDTQAILREHTNARMATPAKFELVDQAKFDEIFSVLDNEEKFRKDMIIEFIAPIELPDTMLYNEEYFDTVMERVAFFKHGTPKNIDWSWTLQQSSILGRKVSKKSYDAIINKALNEYGTIVEMNPAFTRAPAHKQKENLQSWNQFLSNVIDESNCNKATMSMANLNCNSMNFIGLTVLMGTNGPEVHLNVMLHEQAFFPQHSRTNVTGLSFSQIMDRRNELILEGIQRFSKHPLYKDTPYVIALANRLVWEAISALDLSEEEAILPMDVLALYNPYEEGAHLWNEDALKQATFKAGAA